MTVLCKMAVFSFDRCRARLLSKSLYGRVLFVSQCVSQDEKMSIAAGPALKDGFGSAGMPRAIQ